MLDLYHQTVAGVSTRAKVRVRWYGRTESKGLNSRLEIKHRVNAIGAKAIHTLAPFSPHTLRKLSGTMVMAADYERQQIIEIVHPLRPTATIQYDRRYYHAADGRFFFTVDDRLFYGKPGGGCRVQMRDTFVLELKYDSSNDEEARTLVTGFPGRLTRNSKYVNAIEKLYL